VTYAAIVRPEPYWLVTGALVIGDQIVKELVGRLGTPVGLPGVSIGRVVNQSGVFGLDLPNGLLIFFGLAIAAGILGLLIYDVRRSAARLGLWLLFGGALSNTIDRMLHGGVVDVIAIAGLSRFNLADAMIVMGAVALLSSLWRKDRDANVS
jgi:signal peptidase II